MNSLFFLILLWVVTLSAVLLFCCFFLLSVVYNARRPVNADKILEGPPETALDPILSLPAQNADTAALFKRLMQRFVVFLFCLK